MTSPSGTQGAPSPMTGRPYGMPTSAMALQERMLAEFQAVYVTSIEPSVRRTLGDRDSGIVGLTKRTGRTTHHKRTHDPRHQSTSPVDPHLTPDIIS